MINKFILSFIFVFFSILTSLSQDGYFGLKGGYNLTSLHSSGTESSVKLSDRDTYNAAMVFAYKPWKSRFGFSIEPGYTLKGTKTENDSLDYRFHYATLPMLFDFYPIEKLKISVGPEVARLLSARNKINDTTTVSISNSYKDKWELSGTVGVSYSLDFFLDLGLRYNMAFTNISKYDALLDRRNLSTQYLQVFLLFKIAN